MAGSGHRGLTATYPLLRECLNPPFGRGYLQVASYSGWRAARSAAGGTGSKGDDLPPYGGFATPAWLARWALLSIGAADGGGSPVLERPDSRYGREPSFDCLETGCLRP